MSIIISEDTRIEPGVVVQPPGAVGVTRDIAYLYWGSGLDLPTFANAGTIEFFSSAIEVAGFSISPYSGTGRSGLFHNEATGVIKVSSDNAFFSLVSGMAQVWGYYAPSSDIGFLNDGVIDVSSPVWATGLETWNPNFNGANNGSIHATGGYLAIGADIENGGVFSNTGLIEAIGGEIAYGLYVSGDARLSNSGVISADGGSDAYASVAVFVANRSFRGADFHNSGVISGDYAFFSYAGEGLGSSLMTTEVIYNAGDMWGAVTLAYGDDIIHNQGRQDGFTDLGHGDDIYDGVGGQHFGVVFGGEGDDRLTAGLGSDTLFGEDGNDAISGGDGDDFIDGGRGADNLQGGGGFDTVSYLGSAAPVVVKLATGTANAAWADRISGFEAVIGSAFNDNITGTSGVNHLQGNAGNDRIFGGGGADVLLGDAGTDTLTGGGGADRFLFTAGDGRDTITDFDPGADTLEIYGYATYASLQQAKGGALVIMPGGERVLLQGVDIADVNASNLKFDADPLPAAPQAGAVARAVNADMVILAKETLNFIDPAPVHIPDLTMEHTAFVIEPLLSAPAPDVFNAGQILLTVTAAEGLVSAIYGPLAYGDGETWVVNEVSGLIEVTALGGADAWAIQVPDRIRNDGRIAVASAGGDAIAAMTSVVDNTGTLEATALGQATGAQVSVGFLTSGVWNSGQILVSGGGGSVGAELIGANFKFVNSGLIEVTDTTGALDSVGVGYHNPFGEKFLFNTGVIEADYAIRQVDTGTSPRHSPETLYNFGELRGRVDLGYGDDSVYNTGLVTGLIELSLGNDLYDGRGGGRQQGGVDGGSGMDTLLGGEFDDILDGGPGRDVLSGGAGNDILTGGASNDIFRFETGSGADIITDFFAGDGADSIFVVGYASYQSVTQQGADTLVVFSATDSLLLKNVTASALTASDFHFSVAPLAGPPEPPPAPDAPEAPPTPVEAAPSLTIGASTAETLTGTAGRDELLGQGGADRLLGLAGDDRLDGGDGDDIIEGGTGDDALIGGAGADTFIYNYGDGADRIFDFNAAEGDVLVLPLNAGYMLASEGVTLTMGGYVVARINVRWTGDLSQAIAAPTFNLIMGTAAANTLSGAAGNDRLEGLDGNDTLKGANGHDYLLGGYGDDTLIGGGGDDVLDGGEGIDTASYASNGSAVTVILGVPERHDTIGAGYDQLIDIENVIGSKYDDTLWGDDNANLLKGEQGADTIHAGDGDDTLHGGAGGDTLNGDAGDDVIWAGAQADTVHGGDGNDTLWGEAGDDVLWGDGGFDTIHGGEGADIIHGDDLEAIAALDDFLFGDGGDDTLYGGHGEDQLTGGAGADHLYGGPLNDRFIYTALSDSAPSARDIIHDFNAAEGDLIDLEAIDADTTVAGNQAFIMVSAFTGQAGQATAIYSGGSGHTTLSLDVNGDAVADFVLQIEGKVTSGWLL